MFDNQRTQLLTTLDQTHQRYCQKEEEDWPSLHFHLESLETARNVNFERFVESSYAMLASWQMNRGNARMRKFEAYRSSIRLIWRKVLQLREKVPERLNGCDWGRLKEIFWLTRCMKSRPMLVGNSKVMAHLLPELVPPVDGSYTLNFLFGKPGCPDGVEAQWRVLEQILKEFFYPVAQSPDFKARSAIWLSGDRFRWDTSPLKIIDNLIMELSSK